MLPPGACKIGLALRLLVRYMLAMSLRALTRTTVVLEVDESLLVGLTPQQAESLRRLTARFVPAKGGVLYQRRVYTHPIHLHVALTSKAVGHALKARALRGTATGDYHTDRGEFLFRVAKLVLRLDFLRRYWPALAEEVHANVKHGVQGVAWAA